MRKFGRDYVLRIEGTDGVTISIKTPFTMEFDIQRNTLSSANVSTISVYNLSEKNRNQIRKDQLDYGLRKQITLDAGYGDNLTQILNANVTRAYSVRQGNNFITTVDAFDAGFAFANSKMNKSFPAGTAQRSVMIDMINTLKPFGVSKGAIGSFEGLLSRGNAYSGNTIELLKELSGGAFFIDNGKAHILGDNETLAGNVGKITSVSGLLGTPKREQTFLIFDMLFEPRFFIGQDVILESITNKNYNGVYKLVSLHHRGIISDAVSGQATTTVGLFFGTGNLRTIAEEFDIRR